MSKFVTSNFQFVDHQVQVLSFQETNISKVIHVNIKPRSVTNARCSVSEEILCFAQHKHKL